MKIYFQSREKNLKDYFREFERLPFSFKEGEYFPGKLIEARISSSSKNLKAINLDFLFRYDLFPRNILTFWGEWELEDRAMKEGDVIVQQASIPPWEMSLKILFGVRILSSYQEEERAGFSYGTLCGHPETGVNEFVFLNKNGSIYAQVHTRARPGLLLSRFLAPVFTKPYVDYCNHQALEKMKENFLRYN